MRRIGSILVKDLLVLSVIEDEEGHQLIARILFNTILADDRVAALVEGR